MALFTFPSEQEDCLLQNFHYLHFVHFNYLGVKKTGKSDAHDHCKSSDDSSYSFFREIKFMKKNFFRENDMRPFPHKWNSIDFEILHFSTKCLRTQNLTSKNWFAYFFSLVRLVQSTAMMLNFSHKIFTVRILGIG